VLTDHILTLMTFVPAAGAFVVALLPRKGRIIQWWTLLVSIVTFLLTRALPGDPAAYFAGPAATKEAIEQIRKKLGFDKPLIEQFFRYTVDLAHGDFGNSLTTGQPVATEIRNRLPASAELTLLGLVVSIVIALPLGVVSAARQHSLLDHTLTFLSFAGISVPVFWLASAHP